MYYDSQNRRKRRVISRERCNGCGSAFIVGAHPSPISHPEEKRPTTVRTTIDRRPPPPTTSTMSTPEFPEIATPGQPLAPVASYTLGTCVHIFNDRICASIVGQPSLSAPTTKSESKQILSVLRPSQSGSSGKQEDVALTNLLPQVGNNVLARVTRINPRQATVAIFVVGDTVCNDEFQGIIRCGNSRIRRGWARN